MSTDNTPAKLATTYVTYRITRYNSNCKLDWRMPGWWKYGQGYRVHSSSLETEEMFWVRRACLMHASNHPSACLCPACCTVQHVTLHKCTRWFYHFCLFSLVFISVTFRSRDTKHKHSVHFCMYWACYTKYKLLWSKKNSELPEDLQNTPHWPPCSQPSCFNCKLMVT